MTQIKIFQSKAVVGDIEKAINRWLEESDVEVKDIKLSVGEKTTAIVVYKVNKEG